MAIPLNKKPKIAYLLTPVSFGGSEKVNLNFLKNVDRKKYQIYPILLIRPWEKETLFENELLKYNYEYSKISLASNYYSALFGFWRCLYKIKSIVKYESIDLLHTHGYLADILGLLVAKSLNIPIVSTCHGFVYRDLKLRLYFKLDIMSLKYFNGIIAVSNPIKDFLLQEGIKLSKIDIIPNAVDGSSSDYMVQNSISLSNRNKSTDLILGYIGRISKEKGVKYLIEAVALLKKRNIPAKLLIIGEGPDLGKLNLLVKEKDIESDVHFLGFQTNIFPYLKTMDVFVLPSLTEGTPLALLEAMSVNVPVVATSVGGVPDIINDGITGILVNPQSHIELTEAIIKLHSDTNLKYSIIKNASELIEKQYSISSWIRAMQNYYNKILEESHE